MKTLTVSPATGPMQGRLRPPSDKSISHRAALFALLAEGESGIHHYLEADDTLATLRVCEQLGAEVQRKGSQMRIRGRGLNGLRAPGKALDCGNSGTAMRLLSGVLAGQSFATRLVGDSSLSSRPMNRVIRPLQQMGADISSKDGHAPLIFAGSARPLTNQDFELVIASAQVKSCLLLAGLFGEGLQRIREPGSSRDHTERMLKASGVDLDRNKAGWLSLEGRKNRLQPLQIVVPADPSSAAFLLAAALLVPGSAVQLTEVGTNPTRTGLFEALVAMGADLQMQPGTDDAAMEPIADFRVRYQPLKGFDLPEAWVPRMIDELPLLLALSVLAEGKTRIRGAEELRVKESDRLAAMAAGFDALGIDYTLHDDGMDVPGLGESGTIQGGEVDARGDHRIAMSFAVLALRAAAPVRIRNAQMISTSYPDFPAHLQSLGAGVRLSAS